MSKPKVEHKVVFRQPGRPLTADEAVGMYGMTTKKLVDAILANEHGLLDRLTKKEGTA